MSLATDRPAEIRRFTVGDVTLVADAVGDPANPPVLLMHGGGQTRWSWGAAAHRLAAEGYYALSLDLRGHGESGWAGQGGYELEHFAADAEAVCTALGREVIVVGASLGGLAALLMVGERHSTAARALVLVDIVPRIEPVGSERIVAFLRSAPDGFASPEEAADAVAAYLPHRPRPKDTSGLLRNLRRRDNGRYYWHWDPALLTDVTPGAEAVRQRLEDAARHVTVPTLLLRGGMSTLVSPEGVRAFLDLVPDAEFVDVAGADHMVAGDRNDAFNAALLEFLTRRLGR